MPGSRCAGGFRRMPNAELHLLDRGQFTAIPLFPFPSRWEDRPHRDATTDCGVAGRTGRGSIGRPSVSERPTLIRNNSIPQAMPSKVTVMAVFRCGVCGGMAGEGLGFPRQGSGLRLARVAEICDLVELDVLQLAGDLLKLADADRLDDVAALRVAVDRSERARPGEARGGGESGQRNRSRQTCGSDGSFCLLGLSPVLFVVSL